MQKLSKHCSIIYAIFLLLMTAIFNMFLSFGYTFIVTNKIVWLLINIILIAMFTFLCITKRKEATKASKIVAQILPLLSLFYIYAVVSLVDGANGMFFILHIFLCFVTCFIISVLFKGERGIYVLGVIFNSVLLCAFVVLLAGGSLLAIIFGDVEQSTIVGQIISPDKSYTAIIIDSDQGALGGNTLVNIEYNTSEIDVWCGHFIIIKERVYVGGWEEYKTMGLEWQDNNTLLINGKSYTIEKIYIACDVITMV